MEKNNLLKISAADFLDFWKGIKKPKGKLEQAILIKDSRGFVGFSKTIFFIGIEIQERIQIANESKEFPNICFFKSKFNEIIIKESKLGQIQFIDSVGKRLALRKKSESPEFLLTEKSKIDKINISFNAKCDSIRFKDSYTSLLSVVHNSSNNAIIVYPNSQIGNILIGSSRIKEFISIQKNSKIDKIRFQRNSEIGDFKAENCSIGIFTIQSTIGQNISFKKNCIVSDFEIDSNSEFENINIGSDSSFGKLNLKDSQIKRLEISNAKIVEEFQCQFLVGQPIQILFKKTSFGKLNFENTLFPESTTLSVSDCKVNQLFFSEAFNYGFLIFKNLKTITRWDSFVRDQNNNATTINDKFQFIERNADSILHFSNSDLGKLQFINCSLQDFKWFEFQNTKMLEIFLAGNKMISSNQFRRIENSRVDHNQQKRLIYGQLKKIFENRGDKAASLHYTALEMDAYFMYLVKKKWWKVGEMFMLLLGKISTNHGYSWVQGFWVTIIIVFSCYTYFLHLNHFNPIACYQEGDWDYLYRLYSYAPYYLNPLRDNDSIALVKDIDMTPGARIWDFISRIIVAYFVVQTVQAFRKLGKSSG